MKITPIEIRQQTFEKGFRGYEKEAVDAYLNSLSQEWERVSEENQRLRLELDHAEKEINRIKNYEDTLLRALKSTEETRSQIEGEATKEAEKRLLEVTTEAQRISQEAQQQADQALRDAQKKSNMLVADAESKAKYILEEALGDLKAMERDFKAMDRYKDQITAEYKKFANDTLDKIARFEEKLSKHTLETKFGEIQDSLKAITAAKTETVAEPVIEEKPIDVATPSVEMADNQEDEGELPTLSSVMNTTAEASNEVVETVDEQATSAADEIESLIKEVKKGRKKANQSEEITPEPPSSEGGSFFDNL